MKKLLFSLILAGISAVTFNVQSKTWDFSDVSKFTAGAITANTAIDGLSLVTGGSNLTISTTNLATFGDGYAPTQRLQFGGNSYSGSVNPALGTTNLPTRRFVQFPVSNNAVIKFWARGGGSGRSIVISDETGKVLISTSFAGSTSADIVIGSYTHTAAATNLIIATGSGDNSVYKIEYTDNSTLGVGHVKSGIKANAFSSGNKIYVSNLESKNTAINVYAANGSLVKTMKASADTNFDINAKGLYIVNLKSEAGEKSVKVLLK